MPSLRSLFAERVFFLVILSCGFAVYFGMQLKDHFVMNQSLGKIVKTQTSLQRVLQSKPSLKQLSAIKDVRDNVPSEYRAKLNQFIRNYSSSYTVNKDLVLKGKKLVVGEFVQIESVLNKKIQITFYRLQVAGVFWILSFLFLCLNLFIFFDKNILSPINRISEDLEKTVRTSDGSQSLDLSELSQIGEFGQLRLLMKVLYEDLFAKNKRLEDFNYAKDRFLSTVSHELRTPLTAISASLKLLYKDKAQSARNQKLLSVAVSESDRLVDLVNSLLDLISLKAGVFRISPEWISVKENFSFCRYIFADLAKSKNIKIEINLEKNYEIYMDSNSFKQIFSNLISNAIKYTPVDGEIIISASVEKKELVLSVKDSGSGLSKEDQKNIFDIFYQAENSRNVTQKSTGLGLAIVKSLVEAANGSLSTISEEGEGLEVCLHLNQWKEEEKDLKLRSNFSVNNVTTPIEEENLNLEKKQRVA